MRLTTFEALAPVCPRCLHSRNVTSPIKIADRTDMRGDRLWHGLLNCSDTTCWLELPVIDGIPVLVADPVTFLANTSQQILARDDLPENISQLLGDAVGAESGQDATRQHLSIYAHAHFADWTDVGGHNQIEPILAAGLPTFDVSSGPILDTAGSVGRAAWALADRFNGPVLTTDLNFSMLRLAQTLMLEGQATYAERRVGLVYDHRTITLPDRYAALTPDFWACDAMALPFAPDQFAMATAINLVDCVAGPTEVLVETARVLQSGGYALFTTPYDWAGTATEPSRWFGGHSQRGAWAGASEQVFRATLDQVGFDVVGEVPDVPWALRLHARSVMHYELDLVACAKRNQT